MLNNIDHMAAYHAHNQFDVIVVGGGHSGTEAAAVSARAGARTLLLTQSIDTIGQMSCNPAIGGIGKSHLAKEIDALGGVMGLATDKAGIQFRVLNGRRGPAVQATRVQTDRSLYKQAVRQHLENQPNLTLFQQGVDDLIVDNEQVKGVVTQMGLRFYAEAVVLTVGTFLGGCIHIGQNQFGGGRAGDPPAQALAQRLRALPFRVGRLKTGTPPRIDCRSIDFAKLEAQPGDTPKPVFSFMGSHGIQPQQVNCHIAYTTEKTHGIIRQASHLSPMYTGQITDVGPRYCPSIEDKVERFADKASHQIFVEPEGLGLNEIYPNGISTSLPFEVQIDFVRSIPGFEQAHVTRPGYAIEYDFFDPRDLQYSLETKYMPGLFFAGQINGTTGYEEAGAQGIIAGLNAARRVFGLASWTPGRDQAYIGVLIDDLITQGAQEPYRMFTSRAEYRLSLREDNADLRLTELGYNLGIVAKDRYERFQYKQSQVEQEINRLKPILIRPHSRSADKLRQLSGESLSKETHAHELLRRPAVTYQHLTELEEVGKGVQDSAISRQIEIQTKYEGYLRRQQIDIERQQRHESTAIPNNIDFDQVSGLSNEVKQKLRDIKPHTIGQASRIEGMTPAAISLLLVHIKKGA